MTKVLKAEIKLFSTGSKIPVSHLIFADEVLFFCGSDVNSLKAVEDNCVKFVFL